jgi:MFS family permease
MAVVGNLVAPVSEHIGGYLDHFAGVSHVPGNRQSKRNRGRRNGWNHEHRQRPGPRLLGLGFGCNHQAMDIRNYVLLQVGLFWVLPGIASATILTVLSFIILMCYGGGFGTMPAFTADYFGSKNVGPIYGLMLTAWGSASAFGPLLIAHMRQSDGSYTGGLHVIAGIMAVSMLLPILVSPPKPRTADVMGASRAAIAMHSR